MIGPNLSLAEAHSLLPQMFGVELMMIAVRTCRLRNWPLFNGTLLIV